MAKIEKFECVRNDQNVVEKVLMTVEDEKGKQDAEVYLAFADNNTGKRYLMYTTDVKTEESEKITFSLSTLSLQGENYILEETNNLDYSNVQLPIINIVGLNNQKDAEEVMDMIDEKFGKGNISIIDLTVLERNVANITITEKPARKANVPVVIANGIKRFYLNRLNKLLKEIYKATKMTEEQADLANQQLDKIESKLDELSNDYLERKQTSTVEKSLDEIQMAKVDIEQARNRIENLKSIDDEEPVEETELKEENQNEEPENKAEITKEQTYSSQEEVPSSKGIQSVQEPLMDSDSSLNSLSNISADKLSTIGSSSNEAQDDDEKINIAVNNIIEEAVDELAISFSVAAQKITDGLSNLYKEEVKRLMIHHTSESRLLTDSLNEATNKLRQYGERVKEQDIKIESLAISNEQLQKENSDLQEMISSKNEQLSQQNGMIDSFREEIKNNKETSSSREQELLSQIQQLKSENALLSSYKQKYEQVASMFGGQTVSQPLGEQKTDNDVSQKEIEEVVDQVINSSLGLEDQTSKTL